MHFDFSIKFIFLFFAGISFARPITDSPEGREGFLRQIKPDGQALVALHKNNLASPPNEREKDSFPNLKEPDLNMLGVSLSY